MRLSFNWLKELLPDLKAGPKDLAELLTLHSFETEVVTSFVIDPKVTVVRIVRIAPHPKSDRLHLATVTDGKNEITVVCGATNIQEGDVVPYAPPGASLVGGEGKKEEVRTAKIRGIKSPGMLCSLRELGLHHDHSGIWILPQDMPIGASLASMGVDDTVLEADVTPNRAYDCLSHIGIAREIAALLGLQVREPTLEKLPQPKEHADGWIVMVENAQLCPRYIGVVLDNLSSKPSELWMQTRLLAVGVRPISNLVDVTNYVLFEFGNPTHLFDRAIMPGKSIGVRSAREKEELITLDGSRHVLTPDDVIITADDVPVALAGIMGGQYTEVSQTTTKAFLEVATFNAYRIQETSRRLAIPTESSVRFSKGIDMSVAGVAAARAVGLLKVVGGARIVGVIDTNPSPGIPRKINFEPSHVGAVAGAKVSSTAIKKVLKRLRMGIDDSITPWMVTVPRDRLDLEGSHDLVEEVIRVVGLDTILSHKPHIPSPTTIPAEVYWRDVVRDVLVDLGFTETYNYSFEHTRYAAIWNVNKKAHLVLENPPSPQQSLLRISLLPGLLSNLVGNRAAFSRAGESKEHALFEIGNVYIPGKGDPGDKTIERVAGVHEKTYVAGVVVGQKPTLDDVRQAVARAYHVELSTLSSVGEFCTLSDDVLRKIKYRIPVSYFEFCLTDLLYHVPGLQLPRRSFTEVAGEKEKPVHYEPFSKYPSVYRDISILVDMDVSVESVQECIERTGGVLVVDTELFDEYVPEAVPEAEPKKGLAFHIEYQSGDHTLTDKEVEVIHKKIEQALAREFSAQIR